VGRNGGGNHRARGGRGPGFRTDTRPPPLAEGFAVAPGRQDIEEGLVAGYVREGRSTLDWVRGGDSSFRTWLFTIEGGRLVLDLQRGGKKRRRTTRFGRKSSESERDHGSLNALDGHMVARRKRTACSTGGQEVGHRTQTGRVFAAFEWRTGMSSQGRFAEAGRKRTKEAARVTIPKRDGVDRKRSFSMNDCVRNVRSSRFDARVRKTGRLSGLERSKRVRNRTFARVARRVRRMCASRIHRYWGGRGGR